MASICRSYNVSLNEITISDNNFEIKKYISSTKWGFRERFTKGERMHDTGKIFWGKKDELEWNGVKIYNHHKKTDNIRTHTWWCWYMPQKKKSSINDEEFLKISEAWEILLGKTSYGTRQWERWGTGRWLTNWDS